MAVVPEAAEAVKPERDESFNVSFQAVTEEAPERAENSPAAAPPDLPPSAADEKRTEVRLVVEAGRTPHS